MSLDSINADKNKKENKTFLVLLMFRLLESGKEVKKSSFCSEYHLSSRSFDRYIAEIRCYLTEQEPYLELHYEKTTGNYAFGKPVI